MKKMILFSLATLIVFSVSSAPVKSDLAADGAEVAEAWEPTASDYVLDGLYVFFDSIENQGWGVCDK